jgi:hypothetical protein
MDLLISSSLATFLPHRARHFFQSKGIGLENQSYLSAG